jgi:transposase-like protein
VRLPNQEEEDYLMIQETNKNALEVAETGLHEFLVKQNANLDQDIILQLLQSHGKIDDCIRFAESMKQHQKLIVHFINKGEYKRALEMI